MNTLGSAHVLRAVRVDDVRRLQRFHARLSADSVRRRFFGAHPVLADAEARAFTDLDPRRAAAIVAVAGDEEIVAVGRYVRVGGLAAEVAFVVADDHQHQGLGTEMLRVLAMIARDDGIRRFIADTLAENGPMLNVFHNTPDAVAVERTTRDGSAVRLVMRVQPARALCLSARRGPVAV